MHSNLSSSRVDTRSQDLLPSHAVRTWVVTDVDAVVGAHVSEAGEHTPVRKAGLPMVAKLMERTPVLHATLTGSHAAGLSFVSSAREWKQRVPEGSGVG